jgi:predicted O-methyltransferase YrrM
MSTSSIGLSEDVQAYLHEVGVREHPVLARLRADTARLPQFGMQSSPESGALLGLLVRLTGARRIVEVGTFTGYSSTAMALALPADGRIVCCDVSEEWTNRAREAWAAAGVADRVTLRLGPALETLERLLANGEGGTYDMAFVDADKGNYGAYYERALRLLRPGGLVAIDNVLWSGRAADPSVTDESTVAIRELNALIATDERVDLVMVPIADGITLARVRD